MEQERKRMAAFNQQLATVYSLAILQLAISVAGSAFLLAGFSISIVFFCVLMCLGCVVLVYFQPWRIARELHKSLEYKRGLDAIAGK